MRKKCLEAWLDNLRNGTYLQAKGALKRQNNFCPLGILCEMSQLDHWKSIPSHPDKYQYLGQIYYLPKEVAEWAGMTTEEAKLVSALVMTLNDQKVSFLEIADLLQTKYKPER